MQDHEINGNSDDIPCAKLRQLIHALELLKKMMEKKKEAKPKVMAIKPGSHYQETRYSFSNN
jgi:hypothetical protein